MFRGQTALTEPFLNGWTRNYNDLDARLEAFGDHVVLSLLRKGGKIDFGKLSAWEDGSAAPPQPCN